MHVCHQTKKFCPQVSLGKDSSGSANYKYTFLKDSQTISASKIPFCCANAQVEIGYCKQKKAASQQLFHHLGIIIYRLFSACSFPFLRNRRALLLFAPVSGTR